MKCKLVDVFANRPLSGNGLTVFYDHNIMDDQKMLSLTQEMRQFESIFVSVNESSIRARIFTVEEELDFAGHPIIGLAAHLHDESGSDAVKEWEIELNKTSIIVKTKKTKSYFHASMGQGVPSFIRTLLDDETAQVLQALNLTSKNVSSDYLLEVISTGLPYLIVPIVNGIENTKITTANFEALLATFSAKFVYVFDIINFEGRTWDNAGAVEDVATGSAAGPTAAYLTKYALASFNKPITISQGRFVGRPSQIEAYVEAENDVVSNVWISGDVVKVADINFV
ncbi:PhzF family phenazine biosynthesis protein [Psychromonas algicola]|uniref:PhzF family phenazine biosynthesis protein n=1 Tax=Psychromonas algicola TaxID=2555642 RepID=UPI001068ADEE|nr:PhzF family phenazine biosynthesis protein [Psychromonas sp. RZ5]TEW52354.1 PhzF family phenazine biosynthesis protein [Psychromonas sp. RZ5]